MRTLSWRHGRAWIADSPDEWPDTLHWTALTGERRHLHLPAGARGVAAAVAVQRACQTASGGSFFARLGGRLTPSPGDVLEVSIGVVDDPDVDLVLPTIVAGFEAMPAYDRPAGRLELSWMVIHPVDLKPWAWRNAAATLGRLLCDDVRGLDDAAASELALGYTVGGLFG